MADGHVVLVGDGSFPVSIYILHAVGVPILNVLVLAAISYLDGLFVAEMFLGGG